MEDLGELAGIRGLVGDADGVEVVRDPLRCSREQDRTTVFTGHQCEDMELLTDVTYHQTLEEVPATG